MAGICASKGQRQRRGDPEAAQLLPVRGLLARLLGGTIRLSALDRVIARPANRIDDATPARQSRLVADERTLGRQIHLGIYPGHAIEHLLDPRRAGGTSHAADGELQDALRNLEPGATDGLEDLLASHRVVAHSHRSTLGREVDLGLHAGKSTQDLFDPRRAGCTGHARERKVKAAVGLAGLAIVVVHRRALF